MFSAEAIVVLICFVNWVLQYLRNLRLFSCKHVAGNKHKIFSWHFSSDTLDKVWQLVERENALSLFGRTYFFVVR